MNKKTRDMLFLLVILILAIGIGLIINGVSQQEGFVPGLNAFYKPYARKIENYTHEKYENMSNSVHRLMKRCGLK